MPVIICTGRSSTEMIFLPNANLLGTSSVFRSTFCSESWILKAEKHLKAQLNTVGATDSATSPLEAEEKKKQNLFCKSVYEGACSAFNNVERGIVLSTVADKICECLIVLKTNPQVCIN